MNNIFDALEICLNELENGVDVETVLARFPDLAGELRPILEASAKARSMAAPEPSQDAIRRGRARVMQRAAEMRESKVAPRRRVIPAFQRLVISFSLAALLLLSSTGLLNASASALPGENLYPVKRTWEGLRLLLIFDKQGRELLEDQFENERLHEVSELLVEGRHETIQFAGVFMQVNGKLFVSGIQVIIPAGVQLPANGAAVILSGQTNAQGFVEILNLDQLPDGSIVPVGNPVEVENDSESASSSGSENEAVESNPQIFAMEGTLQSISDTTLVINDLIVYLDNAQINGELCPGVQVEVNGYFAEDGRFIVTDIQTKGSCSEVGSGENGNSNSNSNTGDDSGSNDHDSNDNGDDNSGGGSNDNGDDHGGGGNDSTDDHGGGDNSND